MTIYFIKILRNKHQVLNLTTPDQSLGINTPPRDPGTGGPVQTLSLESGHGSFKQCGGFLS